MFVRNYAKRNCIKQIVDAEQTDGRTDRRTEGRTDGFRQFIDRTCLANPVKNCSFLVRTFLSNKVWLHTYIIKRQQNIKIYFGVSNVPLN